MAVVWTAERNAKLLVLILDTVKISGGLYATLSEKWAKEYKNETYKPSVRALEHQILGLRKLIGDDAKDAGSKASEKGKQQQSTLKRSGSKIVVTPIKRARHSVKKTKSKYESDEEISDEHDSNVDPNNSRPLRKTPSRRSKSAGINYREVVDDEFIGSNVKAEVSMAEDHDTSDFHRALGDNNNVGAVEDEIILKTPTRSAARLKDAAKKGKSASPVDDEEGSDVSVFNPHA